MHLLKNICRCQQMNLVVFAAGIQIHIWDLISFLAQCCVLGNGTHALWESELFCGEVGYTTLGKENKMLCLDNCYLAWYQGSTFVYGDLPFNLLTYYFLLSKVRSYDLTPPSFYSLLICWWEFERETLFFWLPLFSD